MFNVLEPEKPLLSFVYGCFSYPPFNPWSDRMDTALLWVIASGFYFHNEKRITLTGTSEGNGDATGSEDSPRGESNGEDQLVAALTLTDLTGVFGLALVFLVATGLVFVVERCRKEKDTYKSLITTGYYAICI